MANYNTYSDKELTEFLRTGDQLAFTEIYDRYQPLLYVYACKLIKDRDIAADIIQELFIYLWDKRGHIAFKASISSYLYSAVRFKFFDLLDKQKVRTDYIEVFQKFINHGEYQIDNYISERELAAIIEIEINNLPEKLREILLLSRRDDLTPKEIAERLNLSEKTIKNQISIALKMLRMRLGLFAFLLYILFKS